LTYENKASYQLQSVSPSTVLDSLTAEDQQFLIESKDAYGKSANAIKELVDHKVLVTGVPIKLQTLLEKSLLIRNFDECVEVYNTWMQDEHSKIKGLGPVIRQGDIDQRAIEEARIDGKYENWKDTVNTLEFTQWFTVQAPEVRALADSSAARDALRMLDLFHETKKRSASDIKQERGARLAAAATTRPGQTPPPKTLDDMSPEELWNYEAAKREKTKAQRGF
jgi:hypothetical protein